MRAHKILIIRLGNICATFPLKLLLFHYSLIQLNRDPTADSNALTQGTLHKYKAAFNLYGSTTLFIPIENIRCKRTILFHLTNVWTRYGYVF